MIHWFVRHGTGVEEGPFSEVQIREGIESNAIDESSEIRQQQGRWFPVAHVREVFRRLIAEGFYLKDRGGNVFGPFTKQRVLEFEQANSLPTLYWIKQGKQREWTEIKTTLATPWTAEQKFDSESLPVGQETILATNEQNSNDVQSHPLAKGNVSIRPIIPAAPVMKLRGSGLLTRLGLVSGRLDDAGDAVISE